MALVIRLRSPSGQFRVQVNQNDSIQSLTEKITKLVGGAILSTEPNNGGNIVNLEKLDANMLVSSLGLQNGILLYSNSKAVPTPEEKSPQKPQIVSRSFIKQDPLDDFLLKQPGTIKRERNPQFCKHGDQGMCEYCMPLEPYDTGYLEENKIKYMSFHAYLRQLIDKGKIPSPHSAQFIAPLDIPDYSVITPCPAGTHGAYPLGICSKCQPSAITLQTQNFRMVDHIEFESPSIVENFLSYWRSSGTQRAGYLYGKYEPYDKVPLGVKAVVYCIYEVAQTASHDFIQIDMNESSQQFQYVNDIARDLGLVRLGVIYTDLLDNGTGQGTVVCKRHVDSYFLSSSEILFSAYMQSTLPVKTLYSPTGEFGSRFITLVVTGNQENQIDFFPYQVSNSAMSMARDKIIEASTDPALMRVCPATPVKYIPDVFFKYKNEYNLMVQEAAKPTFPVEYLLVTASHGFPSSPNPFFTPDSGDFIENRVGMGNRTLQKLKQVLDSAPLLRTLSNFHILLYLYESEILDKAVLSQVCVAVKDKKTSGLDFLQTNDQWATFQMILSESTNGPSGSGSGYPSQSQGSASTPWACPHCTFHNMSGASCEMCGLPRD